MGSPTKSPKKGPSEAVEAPVESPEVESRLNDLTIRTGLTVRADTIFSELLALTEEDSELAQIQDILIRMHQAVRYNIYQRRPAEAVRVIQMAERVLSGEEKSDSLLDNLIDIDSILPNISNADKLLGKLFAKKSVEINEVKSKLSGLRRDILEISPQQDDEEKVDDGVLSEDERKEESKKLYEQLVKAIDEKTGFFGKVFGFAAIAKGALSMAEKKGLTDVDEFGKPIHSEFDELLKDPSTFGFFGFFLGNMFGSIFGREKKGKGESVAELEDKLSNYEEDKNEIFFEEDGDVIVFSQSGFHIVINSEKRDLLIQVGSHFYEIEKDDGFELGEDTITKIDVKVDEAAKKYTLMIEVDGDEYEVSLNDFLIEKGISESHPSETIELANNLMLERKEKGGILSSLKSFLPS